MQGGGRWLRWSGGAALLVLSVLGVAVPPAGAVGDTGLSKLIIADPVPGWQPEPTAGLQHVVSYINQLETDHVVPHGGSALTAVDGWRDPSDHADYVVVALVALSGALLSGDVTTAQVRQAAVGSLASLCGGVASPSSVHASSVAHVPASHTLRCTLEHTSAAASPFAAGWARANVLALVISTQGSLTPSAMDALAARQYAALPARGFVVTNRGAGSFWDKAFSIVGVLILAAAGLLIFRMRVRRSAPIGEPEIRRGVVQRATQRPAAQPPEWAGSVEATPRPPRPRP
jgi:hypothetical protein